MKKCILFWRLFLVSLALLCLHISCEDELENPKNPIGNNQKGSSYDYLMKEGNFSQFIAACEITGHMELLQGKGMSTLFAPTDSAVNFYLKKKGLTLIEEIERKELEGIVGFHFMKYGLSRENLLSFNPDGVESNVTPGIFYKHQTYNQRGLDTAYDRRRGTQVSVFHRTKYMPIFTNYFFKAYNLKDPAKNYQFFYPHIAWESESDACLGPGFSIAEYAIPTDNGYVYHVNQLVDPLKTIAGKLDEREDYTITKQLLASFTDLVYDKGYTEDYGTAGDSIFNYLHQWNNYVKIAPVAFEWATYADNYQQLGRYSYSLCTPTDQAWNTFLSNYFPGKELNELSLISQYYLIENHAKKVDGLLLPEVFANGLPTSWGGIYELDPWTEIKDRSICSNGTFYEIEKVLVPHFFETALSPIFKNDDFRQLEYLLFLSESASQFVGHDDLTLLVANSDAIYNQGIELQLKIEDELGDENVLIDSKSLGKEMQSTLQKLISYNTIKGKQNILDYRSSDVTLLETSLENSFLELYYSPEENQVVINSESDQMIYAKTVLDERTKSYTIEADAIAVPETRGTYTKGYDAQAWPAYRNCLYGLNFNLSKSFMTAGAINLFSQNKGVVFLLPNEWVDNKEIKYMVPTPNKANLDADGTPQLRRKFWESYFITQEENEHLSIREILLGELATATTFKTVNKGVELEVSNIDGTRNLLIEINNGIDDPDVPKSATAIFLGYSKEAIVYGLDKIIYPGGDDFDKLYINKEEIE